MSSMLTFIMPHAHASQSFKMEILRTDPVFKMEYIGSSVLHRITIDSAKICIVEQTSGDFHQTGHESRFLPRAVIGVHLGLC